MGIPNQKPGSGGFPELQTVGSVVIVEDTGFSTLDSSNYAILDLDFSPAAGMRTLGIEFQCPNPASLSANAALFGLGSGTDGTGWVCWVTPAGQIHFEGTNGATIRPTEDIPISAGRWWVFFGIEPRTVSGGADLGIFSLVESGIRFPYEFDFPQAPLSPGITITNTHHLGNAQAAALDGSELTIYQVALWDFGASPTTGQLQDVSDGTSFYNTELIWRYSAASSDQPGDPYVPGTEWVWLLELQIQGRTFAFSTKPVEPSGGPCFQSGLAPLSVTRTADLSSISFTLEGGADWVDLYSSGVLVAFAPARLALWPVGLPYSDRIEILEGRLHDLEFGAVGSDRALVATIRSRPATPVLFPSTTEVVDSTTWLEQGSREIADSAKGASYPYSIGYPGTGDSNAAAGEPAVPALLAYWDNNPTSGNNFCIVGPDILEATDVEFIRTDASNFDTGTQRAVVTLETETDQLGQAVAVVKFPIWWIYTLVFSATSGDGTLVLEYNIAAGTPASGTIYLLNDETNTFDGYAYASWIGQTVTLDGVTLSQDYPRGTEVRWAGQVTLDPDGHYWVAMSGAVGRGGGIKALGESPLRTLGTVAMWALENSGERLDRERAGAEVAKLGQFKIDTVISGRVDLSLWVDSELASVFPISRVSGPDGVYYKLMNYLADKRDISLILDLDRGSNCTQVGPLRVDTAGVANTFIMEYAPTQMSGATKRVQIGPIFQGDVGDTRIYRNEHCAFSYSRYGGSQIVEASPIKTPHVYSDTTAYAVLAHRAARSAFPVVSLEIEVHSLPCVEIGTIVGLRSSRWGWELQPAIVLQVTIAGSWQVLGLELVRPKTLN